MLARIACAVSILALRGRSGAGFGGRAALRSARRTATRPNLSPQRSCATWRVRRATPLRRAGRRHTESAGQSRTLSRARQTQVQNGRLPSALAIATMRVTKRSGATEEVKFDKVTSRIRKLCDGLDTRFVDPVRHRADASGAAPGANVGSARPKARRPTAADALAVRPTKRARVFSRGLPRASAGRHRPEGGVWDLLGGDNLQARRARRGDG